MLSIKLANERAGARGSAAGEGSLWLVLVLALDTSIDEALLGVAFTTGAEQGSCARSWSLSRRSS